MQVGDGQVEHCDFPTRIREIADTLQRSDMTEQDSDGPQAALKGESNETAGSLKLWVTLVALGSLQFVCDSSRSPAEFVHDQNAGISP
jgi:hypothetical protein